MKLFDIIGGKVIIHSDILGIPFFKELWNADSKDKIHATDVLTYIVLKNKLDSPYIKTIPPDEIEEKLKLKVFKNPKYSLTLEEQLCEEEFKSFEYSTLNRRLLEGLRLKLWAQAKYYTETRDELLDLDSISKLNKGAKELKGMLDTIDVLERAAKGEELSNKKIKGDKELNPYELVDGRI